MNLYIISSGFIRLVKYISAMYIFIHIIFIINSIKTPKLSMKVKTNFSRINRQKQNF